MEYILLKWVHIVASTLLFGTGIGSAFYLLFTSLTRDTRATAAVARLVVYADSLFTATTAIIQPLTGWYLAKLAGYPLDARWLRWSIILYAIAIACWVPVVWLQIRLRNVAQDAVRRGVELPAAFWRLIWIWVILGVPALIAFLAIFYLMVAKPF